MDIPACATPKPAIPATILLIDHDMDRLWTTTRLLEGVGHIVLTGSSAAQAASLLRMHRPALLLLDVELPAGAGLEAARQIRLDPQMSRVFLAFFSGNRIGTEGQAANPESGPADGYVVWPCSESEFLARIDAFLRFRSLREMLRESEGRYLLQTEAKPAEDELKFKSFTLDNVAEEIIWLTADGQIWDVNRAACKKLGYSREELLSLSIVDINPLYPMEAWQPHWEVLKRSGNLQFESFHKSRDGHVYPIEIMANYLVHNGLEYNCSIIRDISERKNLEKALQDSEEQFRTLCDSAPIGIFRSDGAENNIYCNPRWEEITGMSAAQAAGKGWSTAIHPDDLEGLAAVWSESAAGGQNYSHEHRQLTPQGKTIWVRALASPIKSQDGTILGHVGTLEDITELRQARQEKLKAQKLESIGVLAGGIAHDFNNILTAILGNISLARYQIHDPEKVVKRLEEAERGAARARDLTQQLLTFARGGEPVKKVIEVPGFLKEAAGFALLGSNVSCAFALPDDLWPLEADEGQLIQVVHNLLLNAVQAMPEGGTVTIGAANVGSRQKGEGFVMISITDTGAGISEQHLPRIFDPYFTTKQQGSGLGLASSYSIIKKHGGLITAESTLGKGSRFEIFLGASNRQQVTGPDARPVLFRGLCRVLVMDDEEIIRDLARAILEELGYAAECVENASQAAEAYLKNKEAGTPFSAVILDLTIPGGVGGKEAVKMLLKIDPEVKAIVSSGYSTAPIMANYREYGFSAVLAKPYRPEEMSKVLRELLPLLCLSLQH